MIDKYCFFQFHPFSLRSWQYLLSVSGWLGVGSLMVLLSGKLFDVRTTDTVVSGALSGSMLYRLLLLFCAMLIIVYYSRLLRLPKGFGINVGLLYVLIAMLSVFWSFVPVASFGKSLEFGAGVVIIVIATNSKRNLQVVLSIFNLFVYFVFYQLALVFVGYCLGVEGFSEFGGGGIADFIGKRVVGPFVSANGVGYLSVLLMTVVLNHMVWKDGRVVYLVPYVVFFAIMLLLSGSRTSMAMCLFSVLMIMFYKNRSFFMLMLVPVLLTFIYVSFDYLMVTMQGDTADSNFMTLSGRTVLWEHALNLIASNLWFGMGFGVGSRAMFFLSQLDGFGDTISTAHNGFIEVLSGVGVVGFVPWVVAFIYMLVFSIRKYSCCKNAFSHVLCVWPILAGVSVMSVGVGGAFSEFVFSFFIILSLAKIYNEKLSQRMF